MKIVYYSDMNATNFERRMIIKVIINKSLLSSINSILQLNLLFKVLYGNNNQYYFHYEMRKIYNYFALLLSNNKKKIK